MKRISKTGKTTPAGIRTVLLQAVLCLLCALLLIGCGGPAAAPSPSPSESPSGTPEPTPVSVPSATLPDEGLQPVSAAEPTLFELAQEYIDRPLDELLAAIGEPQSSVYGPSCLVSGAEDGQLQYDGFWVSTLKNGDRETVRDVVEGNA